MCRKCGGEKTDGGPRCLCDPDGSFINTSPRPSHAALYSNCYFLKIRVYRSTSARTCGLYEYSCAVREGMGRSEEGKERKLNEREGKTNIKEMEWKYRKEEERES